MAVTVATADQSDLVGRWEGVISLNGTSLRLVIRIEQEGNTLHAAMDSPDQNVADIPIAGLTKEGGVVRFSVPLARAHFEGALSNDKSVVQGIWSQGNLAVPLQVTRSDGNPRSVQEVPKSDFRPQTPTPPFPYRSEPVVFNNAQADVNLAGTLSMPQGPGPFPAAILVTGSGPQDRDQTAFGHKTFLVLADALTRRGFAVLRYDDRGVGGSTGDFTSATTRDFASDAAGAFAFLLGRKEIDPGGIGIIGHSEGATVATMVANAEHSVAWVVMIAGPAIPGGDLLVEQVRQLALAGGADSNEADASATVQQELMKAVADNADDPQRAEAALLPLLERSGMDVTRAGATARVLASPWYRWFVSHDPGPDLRSVSAPILALYGGKDLQVRAETNEAILRRLAPLATVVVLPEVNHLMQPAVSGLPSEYESTSTTIAPQALELIADWVSSQAQPQ